MAAVAEMRDGKLQFNKIPFQLVRGHPFPVRFKKEVIEEIFDFIPRDGDVIIATYPKTGTTWLSYIVNQILTKGDSFPTFDQMMAKTVPFLEMTGVSVLESMTTKPRVYKHHFPYNLVRKHPKSKVIYVYRKPEDTLISYYHFLNGMYGPLDFNNFLESFLSGEIGYGGYFENVLSYIGHEKDENLLLVSYEKLQLNRREEILRVAEFLGMEYYNNLVNDESTLDKIIAQTSFDYMKKNLSDQQSPEERVPENKLSLTRFFRKGIIGDGKKTLTESQLLRLRVTAEEVMKGTAILKEWYDT